MKKVLLFITIILVVSISIGCKKNTKERNYDYKLDYYVNYDIYEINFNKDNINVVQKEQVVCVTTPCNPITVKNYNVEYTKEYDEFVERFFKDEKSKSINSNDITDTDKKIIDKIIEN